MKTPTRPEKVAAAAGSTSAAGKSTEDVVRVAVNPDASAAPPVGELFASKVWTVQDSGVPDVADELQEKEERAASTAVGPTFRVAPAPGSADAAADPGALKLAVTVRDPTVEAAKLPSTDVALPAWLPA